MATAPQRKLGDLCTITSGGTPARSRPEYFGGSVPWVKISDLVQGEIRTTEETLSESGLQNSSAKILPAGTVLISIFATIGRTATLTVDAATNQAIAGVTPRNPAEISPAYLRYCLDSVRPELERKARGVAQPNINQALLKSLDVPVPPIEEQRRIVELLSRAENIVRMRREAEQKAKEIIPALFLDMFGDPATNPKGWPIRRFGDLVQRLEGGKNVESGSSGDSPFRILKISAVTSGSYNESESKPAPAGFLPPAHYIVRDGDVLFSRANTEALVGATAIVNSTDGKSLLPDKLWRLVWRSTEAVAPP